MLPVSSVKKFLKKNCAYATKVNEQLCIWSSDESRFQIPKIITQYYSYIILATRLLGGELFQFMGNNYSDRTDNKFNDFFFFYRELKSFFF